MCPGELKANLRLSLQERVKQRRQDTQSLGLQQPEGSAGKLRVETAGKDVPGGASFPMLFPPPRPRCPGGGGTDFPSRLQNPTWNPAEMGRKQMGASAFPVTWQRPLRKPGSQLRRKNRSGGVECASIYTVTTGPWELWCGRLLRPNVLFWKIILPLGPEICSLASSGGSLGGGVAVCLPLLGPLEAPPLPCMALCNPGLC